MADPEPAPFAEPADIAKRHNVTFDEGETTQCEAFMEDVSAGIRAKRPQIDEQITAGAVSAKVVRGVVCQVVARMLTTAGKAGLSGETYPEYSYQLSSAATAGLLLSDAEWELITPASTEDTGRGKAFSIIPG